MGTSGSAHSRDIWLNYEYYAVCDSVVICSRTRNTGHIDTMVDGDGDGDGEGKVGDLGVVLEPPGALMQGLMELKQRRNGLRHPDNTLETPAQPCRQHHRVTEQQEGSLVEHVKLPRVPGQH